MRLPPDLIRTLEAVLSRGERVEIVPVKDGVRIYEVRRREVYTQPVSKR